MGKTKSSSVRFYFIKDKNIPSLTWEQESSILTLDYCLSHTLEYSYLIWNRAQKLKILQYLRKKWYHLKHKCWKGWERYWSKHYLQSTITTKELCGREKDLKLIKEVPRRAEGTDRTGFLHNLKSVDDNGTL